MREGRNSLSRSQPLQVPPNLPLRLPPSQPDSLAVASQLSWQTELRGAEKEKLSSVFNFFSKIRNLKSVRKVRVMKVTFEWSWRNGATAGGPVLPSCTLFLLNCSVLCQESGVKSDLYIGEQLTSLDTLRPCWVHCPHCQYKCRGLRWGQSGDG